MVLCAKKNRRGPMDEKEFAANAWVIYSSFLCKGMSILFELDVRGRFFGNLHLRDVGSLVEGLLKSNSLFSNLFVGKSLVQ